MKIFLSYSGEDWVIAGMITARLDAQGHEIYNWRKPELRGKKIRPAIERGIKSADRFLALLSPSFLEAEWCNREIDMALRREEVLRRHDPGAGFIVVAKVAPVEQGWSPAMTGWT